MEEGRKRLTVEVIFTERFKKDIEYYIKKKKETILILPRAKAVSV